MLAVEFEEEGVMGAPWLNLAQNFAVFARKNPDKVAFKEARGAWTFADYERRTNRLANALLSLGLKKGDKVSCVLDNVIEIIDLYFACAKTGVILNPVNFRLVGEEIRYIVDHAESKALFVQPDFAEEIERIRGRLPQVKHYFITGGEQRSGWDSYEELLTSGGEEAPDCRVEPEDIWVLLYTSGTTGRPKGVLRSHESYVAFYLINAVDFGFTENDVCLTVMPFCHVNSTFFSFTVTYVGGTVYAHTSRGFDPRKVFELIEQERITFISLIPTHYNLMLSVSEEERKRYDLSSIKKLLCSSAPATREMKLAVMEMFPGVELYEGYGSTEAGIVTVLKPHEQLKKLGSIGRESLGTDFVKLLDDDGREVGVGEVGEIYSRGPMLFEGYYKDEEKTKAAFRGEWFSAGDLGRKDEDGYFYIVDRKSNMIITGGEHVFPAEVEAVVSQHPAVLECAVIGVPHKKWGEAVHAVVVLKPGVQASEEEIREWCRGKMAGYKRPKSVEFIKAEDMPRTGSGKIWHRKLRERYWKDFEK